MSGIYGLFESNHRTSNNELNIESLKKWNMAYGKDGEFQVTENEFVLGVFYEAISCHSIRNTKIFRNKEQYAVIDALLYNRDEILNKIEMKNPISDEEVLYTYVSRFGLDALCKVNGDFAGVIYDAGTKEIILFRDHMGVRPLYFCKSSTFFAFSTDIRGLLGMSQFEMSIKEEWIFRTISGYSTFDLTGTEYENIYCVEPATYIIVSLLREKNSIQKKKYWTIGKQKIRYKCDEEYIEKLRDLISDAVKVRANIIKGPIGAELSGGLDSGVIDVLHNRLDRKGIYYSWSVHPDELEYAEDDERLIIEEICKRENITCLYNTLTSKILEHSNIEKNTKMTGVQVLGDYLPFRYILPPYINTFQISEASQRISQEGAKVVFTGHGGDEGVSHRCNPYELFYHKEYIHFLRIMWARAHREKFRLLHTLIGIFKLLTETRKHLKSAYMGPFNAPELLKKDLKEKYQNKKMPRLQFAYDPISYINSGGSRNRLDNVALQGAYSNVRYMLPYLDYRVVNFAVSIPRYMYLKGNRNRYIFREAFKDILPESLYTLRTKETNSIKNLKPNPNWFVEYKKNKKEIYETLTRDIWEKYLDFDMIEEWLNEAEPFGEDRAKSENIFYCLSQFAMAENAIKKSGRN